VGSAAVSAEEVEASDSGVCFNGVRKGDLKGLCRAEAAPTRRRLAAGVGIVRVVSALRLVWRVRWAREGARLVCGLVWRLSLKSEVSASGSY
jgi:hypothetical protein